MPKRKSLRWTSEENETLKRLAGRYSAESIAKQLGRTSAATIMQASKLHISLRTRARLNHSGIDAGAAGFNLTE